MRKVLCVLILAACVPTAARAQVTIPNAFVAGTVASADKVNANFTFLGAQALNRTGGTVTGNISASAGVTFDGIDLSTSLCPLCAATFASVADSVGTLATVRAGGIGLGSQAALDFIYAGSATQLARLAAGTAFTFPRINAAGTGWEFGAPNVFPVTRTVMSGNATLTGSSTPYQFFDPDAARDVTLPANATGLGFVIKNFDASGFALTIKDAAAATVTTVVNGQTVTVIYDGTAWQVIG